MRPAKKGVKATYAQRIVVRMVPAAEKSPKAPAPKLAKTKPGAKPSGKAAPTAGKAPPAPGGQALPGPGASYGALLPGLNELPLEGGGDQPFAPPSQAGATVSDELSGKLDIPLFHREQGGDAHASAKIELKEDSPVGWWFAHVAGDPLLRAVLFEALRDPANERALVDLFRELKSREIVLSLRQRTVRLPDPHERFGESVRVEGNKIVIERTLYLAPPVPDGSGGVSVPLPDEEAKRAVRRDKARLERFQASPAYHSALRNRLP